jgi:quaternary ammonium compound-resistance protein SugE
MMAWLFLLLAAICEMSWPIGLKLSQNFTKLWPTVGTIAAMLLSFYLLSLASSVKGGLPVGTAYAIWTGIGATGVAVIGIVWFGESREWPRLACMALILFGVAGLKLTSGGADGAEKKAEANAVTKAE